MNIQSKPDTDHLFYMNTICHFYVNHYMNVAANESMLMSLII